MSGQDGTRPISDVANEAAITRAGGFKNYTARTPADVAAQLERDAGSLALTGQSFEKDQQFYDKVAANVREAAALLRNWETTLNKVAECYAAENAAAREAGLQRAVKLATMIRESVPVRDNGPAATWRNACNAIANALTAWAETPIERRDAAMPATALIGRGLVDVVRS